MTKPKLVDYEENTGLTAIKVSPNTPDDWWHGKHHTDGSDGGGDACTINPGMNPPWVDDGYFLYGKAPDSGYGNAARSAWNLIEGAKTDIIRSVADFYLLDAVATQVPQGKLFVPPFPNDVVLDLVRAGLVPLDRSDHEITSLWAMYLQALLIDKIAPALHNYMYYACAGEAAHHPHFSSFLKPNSEPGGRIAWRSVYNQVGGVLASKWLAELFYNGAEDKTSHSQTRWSGGWGGVKWGICADVLHTYETGRIGKEKFTAKNFCDRVFSLQHNGGTILNKLDWEKGLSGLNLALDAHDTGDYRTLKKGASKTVLELWGFANQHEGFLFTGFNWEKPNYPRADDDSGLTMFFNGDNVSGDYVEGCECDQCANLVKKHKAKIKAEKEAKAAEAAWVEPPKQTPGQLQVCLTCFELECDHPMVVPVTKVKPSFIPCVQCGADRNFCSHCQSEHGYCDGHCDTCDDCGASSCDGDCECNMCPGCGDSEECSTCYECDYRNCQCECCPDCGSYPCVCCGSCGSSNCNECDGCGFNDCECECCPECENPHCSGCGGCGNKECECTCCAECSADPCECEDDEDEE